MDIQQNEWVHREGEVSLNAHHGGLVGVARCVEVWEFGRLLAPISMSDLVVCVYVSYIMRGVFWRQKFWKKTPYICGNSVCAPGATTSTWGHWVDAALQWTFWHKLVYVHWVCATAYVPLFNEPLWCWLRSWGITTQTYVATSVYASKCELELSAWIFFPWRRLVPLLN